MEKLVIEGGAPLRGKIRISGSKNAALPILFATILCDGPVTLYNLPHLRDITTTMRLLSTLGCAVELAGNQAVITVGDLTGEAPYELVRTMRASVLCLGPLLARRGSARVALPGGCSIGARPVDQHLKAFEKMGATFKLEEGYIIGHCNGLKGAEIAFDMPTVGGTENVLMGAVLAAGETVIENAAREPEVVDLANFLNACGASIEGQGQSIIRVKGQRSLHGCQYSIMPDRIEAGTFMVAAGITGGELELEDCPADSLQTVMAAFVKMGLNIVAADNGNIIVSGPEKLNSLDVKTQPYPGFPTDMQAQIMTLMCFADGISVIEEKIFENRFMHVQELLRMGADIHVSGRSAVIRGTGKLSGAPVMASDLRASASLVLAGLAAEGITEVHRIYHLDRGYDAIEKKLGSAGAKIRREQAD